MSREVRPTDSARAQLVQPVATPSPSEAPTDDGLGLSPPDPPSVAILPFRSLGADSDQGFLADGIRFGIQVTLVQLSGLFLVNATALKCIPGQRRFG